MDDRQVVVMPASDAKRMMTVAKLNDDGVQLAFADGSTGVIPIEDLPGIKDRASVRGVELPIPFEMALETIRGNRVAVPWDLARHYCQGSYRPAIEVIAARGRRTLSNQARHL